MGGAKTSSRDPMTKSERLDFAASWDDEVLDTESRSGFALRSSADIRHHRVLEILHSPQVK